MPNQTSSSANVATSLSSSANEHNKGEIKVIRKFINSAVYVEKPIMPPLRKTSPILVRSDSGYTSSRTHFHTSRSRSETSHDKEEKSTIKISSNPSDSSTSSDNDSQITIKSNNVEEKQDRGSEMRLSLCSLSSARTGSINPKEKEEMIKCWIQKKDKERQKKEMEEAKLKQEKERQRVMLLEKDRENYKKWLARKKQEEEREIKKEREKREKENRMKEIGKEKKKEENEASFEAWLKRKKRMELEKKIKDKLALLKLYEEKQRRMDENDKAFNEWLKSSKDKPKPIPLNKGLESLCSSTSVTYVNPIPWMPNVETPRKPSSQ